MADRRHNCIAWRNGRARAAAPAGLAAAKPAKRWRVWQRIVCVFLAVILFLGLVLFGLQIGVWAGNAAAVYVGPAEARIDLSEILAKEELSSADYEVIYRQTGLTRAGVDRCLQRGEVGINRILAVQNSFYASYELQRTQFGFFCVNDFLAGGAAVATTYLENGDILVTSAVRLSGYTMGHAGLVTDAAQGQVLQAVAYGYPSGLGSFSAFARRPAFMILSPRTDAQTKAAVAAYAEENLVGIPYDITAGVLSDKNSCESTQCAHIVWYAYSQFGLDIDGDGGLVVTPHDLATSPLLEVVQVYGFDLDDLWQ